MKSALITVLCGDKTLSTPGRYLYCHTIDNQDNKLSPRDAYQQAYKECNEHVLMYSHCDVTIHDPNFVERVMEVFLENDNVGAVGFGGATCLGSWNLHRRPYYLPHMARSGFISNLTDAEIHGTRIDPGSVHRVAVLDAFFMAVRRDALVSYPGVAGGGWPTQLTHHCLDLWLACELARQGLSTYAVGVSCTHHGGGASTKAIYQEAKWLQGGSPELDHQLPHEWLFREYKNVLPIGRPFRGDI
jgi:GT2 family glycosyltransferase